VSWCRKSTERGGRVCRGKRKGARNQHGGRGSRGYRGPLARLPWEVVRLVTKNQGGGRGKLRKYGRNPGTCSENGPHHSKTLLMRIVIPPKFLRTALGSSICLGYIKVSILSFLKLLSSMSEASWFLVKGPVVDGVNVWHLGKGALVCGRGDHVAGGREKGGERSLTNKHKRTLSKSFIAELLWEGKKRRGRKDSSSKGKKHSAGKGLL